MAEILSKWNIWATLIGNRKEEQNVQDIKKSKATIDETTISNNQRATNSRRRRGSEERLE